MKTIDLANVLPKYKEYRYQDRTKAKYKVGAIVVFLDNSGEKNWGQIYYSSNTGLGWQYHVNDGFMNHIVGQEDIIKSI